MTKNYIYACVCVRARARVFVDYIVLARVYVFFSRHNQNGVLNSKKSNVNNND